MSFDWITSSSIFTNFLSGFVFWDALIAIGILLVIVFGLGKRAAP